MMPLSPSVAILRNTLFTFIPIFAFRVADDLGRHLRAFVEFEIAST